MLRNRKGFTLIELLIVVVIIGILAAIALPKFGSTREAAYFSTCKADLNNLRSAQEVYYTTGNYEYAPTGTADLEFASSSGTTVTWTIQGANNGSYQAVCTHNALPATDDCAMYYGDDGTDPGVNASPTSEGQIACTD